MIRDRKIGKRLSAFSIAAWRAPLMLGVAATFTVTAALADPSTRSFAMPAQDLAAALNQFSVATDRQIVFSPELVNGVKAPELRGDYTPEQAIAVLLAGTSLTYQPMESGTYAVFKEGEANPFVGGGPMAIAQAGQPEANPDSAIDPATIDPGVATEPTTESVTSQKRGGIEEIIVTARKREESVQDIPISITALSAEDLKAFGVRNFSDMEGVVPGLNLGGGGNGVKKDSSPFIRGIGQRETKVTLDPAVGTYIDGIYIGRAAGAMLDVVNVETVEVLRGPQGTLFGKNATGGAISVTTRKPGRDLGAQIGVNVGNYGRSDASFAVNVPIVDDVLLSRLTIASTNSEGFFTNVEDNTIWGGDNRITGIGQLRWLVGDSVTVDVLGERTKIRETPRPQRCQFIRDAESFNTLQLSQLAPTTISGQPPNPLAGSGRVKSFCDAVAALPQDQFASDAAIGDELFPKARYWVDTSTVGLTGTWDVGDVGPVSGLSLKSISAWRKTEQIADEDLDAMPTSYIVRIQPDYNETTQYSQELQVSGKAINDRLFFSTGLYYFAEETPSDELILSAGVYQGFRIPFQGAGALFFEPVKERLRTDNEAYAWYGQLDFDITPELQATAGVRYTRETRFSRYDKAQNISTSLLASGAAANVNINGYYFFRHPSGNNSNACDASPASCPDVALTPVLEWQFGDFVGDELTYKGDSWTPMFSLKYKPGAAVLESLRLDDAMTYATYSKGYHSGGVTAGAIDYDLGRRINRPPQSGIPCPDGNPNSCILDAEPGHGTADPIIFKPEYVDNYEVGLKLSALDRRLQANLAVFYMEYTDMQVTSNSSRGGIPIPYIENVGKSVIKGVEGEFVALLTPEWRVVLNGGYTESDIKEWLSSNVRLNSSTGNPGNPPVIDVLDRSDEPLPRLPRVQAFLLTDYIFNLSAGSSITPSLAVRYSSEIYHGFDRGSYCFTYGGICPRNPGGTITGTTVNPPNDTFIVPVPGAKHAVTSEKAAFLDARLSWISADTKLEIAAWGKNLLNKDDYLVGGIPLADVTGAVGQIYANPRTFGLNMTYNFGVH